MSKIFKVRTNEIPFIDESDYLQVAPYIIALDATSRTTYQSIYVIDYYKMIFLYVSENPLFLCGCAPEKVKNMGFNFYLSHVPAREQELLQEINKAGFDFCESVPVGERTLYTISYDFHLLHGKKEILINHKLSPMILSREGKVWLAVCSVSLSAYLDAGHIEARKKGSPEIWKYNPESHKWKQMPDIRLTERGHSVLTLSAQGHTIKEIARRLFIQEETVKYHRLRLFEQLGVKNITEALFMAINSGLI